MQIKSAIKIIAIFLVVMILLLAILLLATNKPKDGGDETADGTSEADITTADETTGTDDVTTGESTGTTAGAETTVPQDTSSSSVTTAPDETTKPDAPAVPANYEFKKTLKTDNGTALALRADCYGVKEGDKVKVTVSLYLEYRSIEMRERSGCRLSLGDVSKTFGIEALSVEDNGLHTLFVCSVEKLCGYGDDVAVYARMPFRGTYAGVDIEFLEIDSYITLE